MSKTRLPRKGVGARIWDLPTRAFHWMLVILIAFSWWSHPMYMEWHRASGYAILGLVLFRLVWGLVGTSTARFKQFLRGPRATIAYVRELRGRKAMYAVGHNPLGGWSVMIMLCLLLFQVISGLFSVDVDGIESGPLSDRIDFETGRWLAMLHGASFTLLEVFIGVHVAAILFYLLYKRSNLITPMLTGGARDIRGSNVRFAKSWKAIFVGFFVAAFAWWASTGFRG